MLAVLAMLGAPTFHSLMHPSIRACHGAGRALSHGRRLLGLASPHEMPETMIWMTGENATSVMTNHPSWPRTVAWMLGVVFAFGMGVACWLAWTQQTDCDLRERYLEYCWFREGTYPSPWLEPQVGPRPQRYSVYPPYAFPMFAVLFEPGGMTQGRLMTQVLSLASLVVISRYGSRALAGFGPAVSSLGAVAGLAIAGNLAAIKSGQLSIICMGLVVLQMESLADGRRMVAGLCWALAMVKPQIGLPFAALLVLRRDGVALAVGTLALTLLTMFTCWWTGVTPEALADHWLRDMSLRFGSQGFAFTSHTLARALNVSDRLVLAVSTISLTVVVAVLAARLRSVGEAAMLPVAAVCSALGMFLCYHRHYDNVMLFPAVLLAIATAARTRRWIDIMTATAFMTSLVIPLPMRFLHAVPAVQILLASVWLVGGLLPVWKTMRAYSIGMHTA